MRIVLLGPPGSGKGTQAQRLSARTGARHIATGNLVRAEIERGTPLGRRIGGYNERGELVPDDMIAVLVKPLLIAARTWILDGFPRDLNQARLLDAHLVEQKARLDRVILLEVPDATLIARLSGRRTSEATGNTYHVVNNPPPPGDPGPFVQRRDDEPNEIKRRLEIYHHETAPLASYYEQIGVLSTVDAGQAIDAVAACIDQALADHGVAL